MDWAQLFHPPSQQWEMVGSAALGSLVYTMQMDTVNTGAYCLISYIGC